MKTKFKNKLRYIAAGIFMMGLVANVSLSLTDPFVHVGTDLLAQTSGNSSGSGTGNESCPVNTNCDYATQAPDCDYTCVKIVINWLGQEVRLEEIVQGERIECFPSQGNRCKPQACTPVIGCPQGYS